MVKTCFLKFALFTCVMQVLAQMCIRDSFTRENGTELVLFFPHPGYWTQRAKSSSKQPVAIQGSSFIEIAPDSKLQTRLLELLANDIVDGKQDRDTMLTIIRIRDCLLHRAPLAEIVERYDPKTWQRRDGDGFK